MAPAERHGRGLVQELQRSHVFTLWVLAAVLVMSAVSSSFLIVNQSALKRDLEVVRTARDAREAMVDQETGLRGWLASGDEVFLQPYESGRVIASDSFTKLQEAASSSPELTDDLVDLILTRERWEVWAEEAASKQVLGGEAPRSDMAAFLLEGKALFDAYRAADETNISRLQQRRDAALRSQTVAQILAAAGFSTLLVGALALTVHRRRRLRSSVLEPIDRLLETIGSLRAGDLDARADPSGVPELDQIGTEVGRLARGLAEAQAQAAAREARLSLLAERFETVVTVSREISGSLSVRYVSRSVTTAAANLLNTPATLWVPDSTGELVPVDRSDDVHGVTPPADLMLPEAVTMAAAQATQVDSGGRRAYPLVLAGTVVAVLDCESSTVDDDTAQVLTALLATAAAALESAHLHSAAREQADMDGLTGLANRRRFEVDLDEEWERCRRYGRPLSVVMLDLDHFKSLNDNHGHLLGDEVLRAVATAINATTRATDTAYRYGGEEIVVLLRETGLEDATGFAERLRTAVSEVQITDYQVAVTTSAGVASRQASMSHYTELIAVADRALYAAKRGGRNRVMAESGGIDPQPVITAAEPLRAI